MTTDSTAAPVDTGGIAGHPSGLTTLFFTEMWERFSYYGMRALLVLFMTAPLAQDNPGLGFNVGKSTAIYGLYTSMVYLLSLPGGWLADNLWGQRKAVFVGGCIIAAGHFSMAVPTFPTFYLGLVLIALGTGLLKPNVSTMVADLYPEGGARRDAGFSIFYMGINLGALAGPIICGFLGERFDWRLGFAAAGVGMLLGVAHYAVGWRVLGDAGTLRARSGGGRRLALRTLAAGVGLALGLLIALAAARSTGLLTLSIVGVARATGVIIAAMVALYFACLFIFGRLDPDERKRLAVIPLLFLAAAVFWSGFEQAGSSMTLFADRLTDRVVFQWEIPVSWLQSINPLFIILLAPVAGEVWIRLGSRNPSFAAKFAYGLVLLGAGFFVLAWAAAFAVDGALVSPMWLVATYFLHTTGELCLSPVGLSSITKLSPRRFVGQMMGIWFMAAALGNLLAGLVAGLIESLALPQLFGMVGLVAAGTGLLVLVMSGPVRRLSGDVA